MKFLIDLISEQLSGAFEKAGFDAAYGRATLSNRPDLCEYQCNGALAAAKKYHKAPIQIANAVLEALGKAGKAKRPRRDLARALNAVAQIAD